MARTRTLAEMRTDIRNRGDYANSAVFTDPILTDFINSAIAEAYELIASASESYYVTSATVTTTAGQDYVALPSTVFKVSRVDLLIGGTYVKQRKFDLHSFVDDADLTEQYMYRVQGANLYLMPTPTVSTDTLKVWYTPYATKLAADGDTFDGVNGFEELVIQLALYRCDQRDRRPTGERLQEIARLMERVRKNAEGRDSSEPFYLPDHGGDGWL